MEDGRGDHYAYDPEGQLTAAVYQALNPETEDPVDPRRGDIFQYDAMGNRWGSSHVANRGDVNFTSKVNGLNQYHTWYALTKYDDDLGWGSPGHANGVLMQEGYITASFNALNQPMAMWSPA
jgi:hypothetical protein